MSLEKLLNTTKSAAQNARIVNTKEDLGPKASSDTSSVARTGLWVLGLGFGGFLLWAGLAPLRRRRAYARHGHT
jgi:membrane fusion protein, protease secretion system